MILAYKLAYKNLIGAGLRTWLNVFVLSLSFVLIIFLNGMMDGWNQQAKKDSIEWEYGQGQYRHKDYDPYDPFSLQDGHGIIPASDDLTAILIRQAAIYPNGRLVSALLKGIDVKNNSLAIPTKSLSEANTAFPAVIGKRMAESAKIKIRDKVLLRWRDQHGTFDATEISIVDIFDSNLPSIDIGQIWVPIDVLWQMTGLHNHASLLVSSSDIGNDEIEGWIFMSQSELMSNIDEIISMKKYSSSILYLMLLALALLAIFDTQVLSIFRRQKEIGTYISLGMTRSQVVGLFTAEGSMYSLLALILGTIYGAPIFIYMASHGIAMPQASQDMGVAIAERIFPVYGLTLVLVTMILIILASTIVSYLPALKIARLDPVAALKGKLV